MKRLTSLGIIIYSFLIFSYSLLPAQISPISGDSLALIALYDSLDGSNWINATNWKTSTWPWHGVTVDSGTRRVTRIQLVENNLSGIIPSDLSQFTDLQSLLLEKNQITEVASFNGLNKLSRIVLSQNQISKLPTLDDLSSLGSLHINQNKLDSLPSLSSLTLLRVLSCNDNQLINIPDLSNNSLLGTLYFGNNRLTLFPNISSGSNFRNIDFENNQFSEFPDISSFDSLRTLICSNNRLIEIPDLSNFSALQDFRCDSNQLTVLPALGFKPKLINLIVNNNLLSDLPDLSTFSNLVYLDAGDNFIDTLKGLESLLDLQVLRLYRNQLTSLPDFSNLINLRDLVIHTNALNFKDLSEIPENIRAGLNQFVYAVQAPIPVRRDTSIARITLSVNPGGINTIYNWFKDENIQSGLIDSFNSITLVDSLTSSLYRVAATNPDFPALFLTSLPVDVCTDRNLCDFDQDGDCDLRDLDPLAYTIGSNGNERLCGSEATDWGLQYLNLDYRFFDCNGDGQISRRDTFCLHSFYEAMATSKFLREFNGVDLTASFSQSASINGAITSTSHSVQFAQTVDSVKGVVFVREIIPPAGFIATNAYHELDSSDFAIRNPDGSINEDSMLVFTRFFASDTSLRSPMISSPNARIEVGIFRTNGSSIALTPSHKITTCKVTVEKPPGKRKDVYKNNNDSIPITFISYVMVFNGNGEIIPMGITSDTTTLVFPIEEVLTSSNSEIIEKPLIRIYPNPIKVGHMLEISASSRIEKSINLRIIGLNGNVVLDRKVLPLLDGRYKSIEIPKISKGLYVLEILADNQYIRHKIIVN